MTVTFGSLFCLRRDVHRSTQSGWLVDDTDGSGEQWMPLNGAYFITGLESTKRTSFIGRRPLQADSAEWTAD